MIDDSGRSSHNIVKDGDSLMVDAGTVNDGERICCKGRRGCRKKTCCARIVYFFIVFDIMSLICLIGSLIVMIFIKLYSNDESPAFNKLDISRIWRVLLVWLPFYIPYFLKTYYGLLWMRKRPHSRTAFLPCYRMSLTLVWANIPALVVLFSIHFKYASFWYLFLSAFYMSYLVFELTVLYTYIGFLDRVHYAKTALLRDEQILRQYL